MQFKSPLTTICEFSGLFFLFFLSSCCFQEPCDCNLPDEAEIRLVFDSIPNSSFTDSLNISLRSFTDTSITINESWEPQAQQLIYGLFDLPNGKYLLENRVDGVVEKIDLNLDKHAIANINCYTAKPNTFWIYDTLHITSTAYFCRTEIIHRACE